MWKIVLGLWAVLGVYDLIGGQLSKNKLPNVSDYLPDWRWQYWFIGILIFIIMNLLEGIYEKGKESEQENWILAHKLRTGKLPPVPDCLLPIVDSSTYKKGNPITTNIKVIPMSAQLFNKLSPTDKQNLKQFLGYLGINSSDYEWEMRQRSPPEGLHQPIKYNRR